MHKPATKAQKPGHMNITIVSMIRKIANAVLARIVLVVRRRSTISVIVRESVISSNQNDMKYHALTMQQSMEALVLTIKVKICEMREVRVG